MNHKECVARGCALTAAMSTGAWSGNGMAIQDVYPFRTLCLGRPTPSPSWTLLEAFTAAGDHLLQAEWTVHCLLETCTCELPLSLVSDSPDCLYQVTALHRTT